MYNNNSCTIIRQDDGRVFTLIDFSHHRKYCAIFIELDDGEIMIRIIAEEGGGEGVGQRRGEQWMEGVGVVGGGQAERSEEVATREEEEIKRGRPGGRGERAGGVSGREFLGIPTIISHTHTLSHTNTDITRGRVLYGVSDNTYRTLYWGELPCVARR